MVVYRSIKC